MHAAVKATRRLLRPLSLETTLGARVALLRDWLDAEPFVDSSLVAMHRSRLGFPFCLPGTRRCYTRASRLQPGF